MAYFECIVGNGGGGGTGIPLIATCSEDFAGKTITATDGTTTLTETCPSVSPYTVQFDLPNTGTWTISGVIEGVTYSETITVTEYQLSLETGINYKTWVSRGGLDPDDYASLSAVFADEAAVRRLMLVHASADYLIDCVTDNIDDIDDFCANDTAMKWLGLCDYVCDGLTAITGVKAKLLASTYWERYLKDHVPVMTSDSAPYGEAISSGYTSGYNPYRAFDGNNTTEYSSNSTSTSGGQWLGFKFTNPISVRKIFHLFQAGATSTVKVQYSDDGTNYTDTGDTYTITNNINAGGAYIDVTESGYHLYWRVYCTSSTSVSDFGTRALQFYGRALNVSVPVMTSNTAPYGEVIYFKNIINYQPWMAFNNSNSEAANEVVSGDGVNPAYIGYDFKRKVLIRKAKIDKINYAANETDSISLVGSNDKSTWTVLSTDNVAQSAAYSCDVNTETEYRYYAFRNNTTGKNIGGTGFQFYGVDYSEKEFESGTTKKWLYDNGVELEPFEKVNSFTSGITKEADYLQLDSNSSTTGNGATTSSAIDTTNYDLFRVKVGDVMGAGIYVSINANKSPTWWNPAATSNYALSNGNLPNNLALDISSFDGNYYPMVVQSYPSNGSRIVEMWLEP